MAALPVPRSYNQILGDLIAVFASRYGIPSLKVGGPILSLLEAVAQSQLRSAQDVWQALDARDLDSAAGEALDRIGRDEDVLRRSRENAYGYVTISDTSFEKVSTQIHQGRPAPIAGSTSIDVVDGEDFLVGEDIYLGRGTPRFEGPLTVNTVTDNTTYWTLELDTPTQRFHVPGEGVVMAQGGNRLVAASSSVQTGRTSTAEPEVFRLASAVTVPDGETELADVLVTASKAGITGNAPAGAIREFTSAPFTGAAVTNPRPYTTGKDTEDDDTYRQRIRTTRVSRLLGTALAIRDGAIGALSVEEGRRVASASFVRRTGQPSLVVIDDGNGYEQQSAGIGYEQLLDNAAGGEEDVALRSVPVEKAFITAGLPAPYSIEDGARLTVEVGGVDSTHIFRSENFAAAGAATAYEVAASINADSDLDFGARTDGGGTLVVLYARSELNEGIEVVASIDPDANDALRFPAGQVRTLYLYKNDRLLSKDGSAAVLESLPWGSWTAFSSDQTIELAVDGTPAVTYTFTDQDFVDNGTGFAAIGKNSAAAWVTVLNARCPGITATTDGSVISLSSNRGVALGASLEILGGTLVANRAFTAAEVVGTVRDYVFDRSRGQIRLEEALDAGDRLSAGSLAPRAFLESGAIAPVTLSEDGLLWAVADSGGELVSHGVGAGTPLTLVVNGVSDWGYTLQLEAYGGSEPPSSTFESVQAGDWVVLWDSDLQETMVGAWRVESIETVTWGDVDYKTILNLARRAAHSPRAGHRAVALVPVGGFDLSRVLVTGGWVAPSDDLDTPIAMTSSVEMYTPDTEVWEKVSSMATPRAYHTATTTDDGLVVVVGGIDTSNTPLNSVEIWDPDTGLWTAGTPLPVAAAWHQAILLADGTILVCGGWDGSVYLTNSYVYDPGADTWSSNVPMATARAEHGIVRLPDDTVLVVGGSTTGGGSTVTCEIFDPSGPSWASADPLPTARKATALALWSTTLVVAVGDDRDGSQTDTYAVYTIGTDSWGSDTALGGTFANSQVVTLQSGDIVAAYGESSGTPLVRRFNGTVWSTATDPQYASSPSVQGFQAVLLYDNGPTVLDQVLYVGGLNAVRRFPSALVELYDGDGDEWIAPDPAQNTLTTLSSAGISFARTDKWLRAITIPAATNYTASSLVEELADVPGMTVNTFRTNRLRLGTASYAEDGDILLAAADAFGQLLDLNRGFQDNLVGHIGSVETGRGDGTSSFSLARILEDVIVSDADDAAVVRLTGTNREAGDTLILSRNPHEGIFIPPFVVPFERQGRNAGFSTTFRTFSVEPDATYASLRADGHGGLTPLDRCWLAAPYALGADDTLTVLVDGNVDTKRFSIPMSRRLLPVGSTYGTTCEYTDADNASESLAAAFGLEYSFDDMAIHMRARGKAFEADSTRSALFRYYLHGPAGERARVRISYPEEPEAVVACSVDSLSGENVDVRVALAGGAERTIPTLRGSTKIGTAVTAVTDDLATIMYVLGFAVASAQRDGSDETTLILTLPTGVSNSGLQVGDVLWFASTNPNWSAGTGTLTDVDSPSGSTQAVYFTNAALGTGASGPHLNAGTFSFDSAGEVTLSGTSVAANDFVRVNAGTDLPDDYTGETFRIDTLGTQYISAKAVEKTIGSTDTTVTWSSLNDPDAFVVFENPADDMTTFAAAVNALAAEDQSTCPVTMTVLGDGSGTLESGTVEDLDDAAAWVSLEDGLNWVSITDQPSIVADNYALTFKLPTSANLATDSDWQAEDVRVVPSTPANLADWLEAPPVSGLFTAASVELSDSGRRVQLATLTTGSSGSIQVQGGLANSVEAEVVGTGVSVGDEMSVQADRSDELGLLAGSWVRIANESRAQKVGIMTSGTVLTSWATDGTLTLSTAVYTALASSESVKLQVEHQGDLILISDPAGINAIDAVDLSGVAAGDWVRLTAPTTPTDFGDLSDQNLGIFRVARVQEAGEIYGTAGGFWIENTLAVDEVGECNLDFYSYDSCMPGDELTVSMDLWRPENRTTWTIVAVGESGGDEFADDSKLRVSIASRSVQAVTSPTAALGTSYPAVQVVEGEAAFLYKRIITVSPTDGAGSLVDVRLDNDDAARLVSDTLGSVMQVVDKLRFPTEPVPGVDAYRASTGLVGEVGKLTYGDDSDPVGYPGIAAEGAEIVFSGPTVKRFRCSLQLRTGVGFARDDIAARVRSTVAAAVNRVSVGTSLALSEIVRAASAVQGVTAVTILSPAYSAANDVVTVRADEKLLVLDLTTDVTVTFVSD